MFQIIFFIKQMFFGNKFPTVVIPTPVLLAPPSPSPPPSYSLEWCKKALLLLFPHRHTHTPHIAGLRHKTKNRYSSSLTGIRGRQKKGVERRDTRPKNTREAKRRGVIISHAHTLVSHTKEKD